LWEDLTGIAWIQSSIGDSAGLEQTLDIKNKGFRE